MALGRYIKEQIVKEFEKKISNSHAIVLCGAAGLKVGEINELRARMNREKIDFLLMKNTLACRAFQNLNIDIKDMLKGDTFYAFGQDDPVSVSKILVEFSRNNEALKIKGGIVEKKVVGVDEIKRYASIPSREVLIQHLMASIKAPVVNLVMVLNAPLRKLLLVLEAVREAKKMEE